jgi:hypothetical protein
MERTRHLGPRGRPLGRARPIVALAIVVLFADSVNALLTGSAATIVTDLIVTESGFGLAALATADATVAAAARTWSIVFVAGRR